MRCPSCLHVAPCLAAAVCECVWEGGEALPCGRVSGWGERARPCRGPELALKLDHS